MAAERIGLSLLRSASVISLVTLASRVLGLIRDAMMTHVLGTSWAMGTFNLAWMFPNLLRRLFGEGALSAAFVPAFARSLRDRDEQAPRRLLAAVLGPLTLGLLGLTAVVVAVCLVLPPASLGLRGGAETDAAERGRLLLDLTLVLFPYVLPICAAAILAGALNALGHFALPAASPVVLNLFWIGGIAVATGASAGGSLRAVTMTVAAALLAGGAAQLALNAVPLARRGLLARPRLPRRGDPAARVFTATFPSILGLSLVQLNLLVDQTLAEYLIGPGTNTHVYLANRLLLFPHALTALAAATAVFPRLAHLAAAADRPAFAAQLQRTLHGTMLLVVPASVGLILVAGDLIPVVFVHGRYDPDDAAITTATTAFLVAGLPFISASQLYARACFALGDHRTPARWSAWLLVVNLGCNLAFVLGFGMDTRGLTLATTISAATNAVGLRHRLRQLLPTAPGGSAGPYLRILLATAGMAAVVVLVAAPVVAESRWSRALWHVAVPTAAGIAAYAFLHFALGGRELRRLWRRR